MSMQQDKLLAVNGKLIWRNLGFDDDGSKIDIGDYQVDFSGDASAYDFTFSDLNAALDVSGDGSVSSAGVYEVDVRISAENGMVPQVKSILDLVAVRSSVNQYRIEQKGRLPANITRQPLAVPLVDPWHALVCPQCRLLKHNPMTFVLVERMRMIGGIFCECLGGFAACGLLRKRFPQSSDRSRTLDASVFWLK